MNIVDYQACIDNTVYMSVSGGHQFFDCFSDDYVRYIFKVVFYVDDKWINK